MPSEWAYKIAREQRRDAETMAANLDAARAEGKAEGRIEGLEEAIGIVMDTKTGVPIAPAIRRRIMELSFITGLLIGLVALTSMAKAAPIESLPIPQQYWYTTDIPTPAGVFAFEVYAPALPRIVASDLVPIIEIGDPPRLVDVPEPGTGWLALACWWLLWRVRRKILRPAILAAAKRHTR